MALERLQKIIARAGVASRRKAEELILEGRVSVNGVVARELGTKADAATAQIQVNGKPLRTPRTLLHLAFNKPRECVTTLADPEGRPTVMDFLRGVKERVYPVGRLDYHTEGLLLLTNDGEFANRILSAAAGIPKTYWVKVAGMPAEEDLEKLRRGILLDGRRTRTARIRPLSRAVQARQPRPAVRDKGARLRASTQGRLSSRNKDEGGNPWFEVILQEGRQNQIRRMFERIGHPVRKLKRVRVGSVSLGNLASGRYRPLTPAEVASLRRTDRIRERE